mmetsp:Transcript_15984/g.23718  ORF Transcript_15984/g.23718 Transcript_15984/m.23718 type:complete len:96 (-) Transcript_15984:476-763(-)
MTSISVLASKELVGSSHSKIGEFFSIARAMATLCFSPPEIIKPLSPTNVWYFLGIFSMVCSSLACLATSWTLSQDSSIFPYCRLYSIVSLNSTAS